MRSADTTRKPRIITIKKENYFELKITLHSLFTGNPGTLQYRKLFACPEIIDRSRPYHLKILMNARFYNNTDSSLTEIKKWVRDVMERLENENSDNL